MNIPYVMRKCSKCGRWLVASTDNFHKQKAGKYGLDTRCKECAKKRNKQHYQNNKEKIAEQHKQWRLDNKDKMFELHKQWCENNKEKVAEHYKRYSQSPKGRVASFNHCQRRRAKEEQQGTGITKEQWLEMMNFFGWKCAYSGEYLGGNDNSFNRTIDHIVPISTGGDNMIWNCVPMTRSLNSSKCAKDMLEWYKEQNFYSEDRLAKIYEWQEYARKKWKK